MIDIQLIIPRLDKKWIILDFENEVNKEHGLTKHPWWERDRVNYVFKKDLSNYLDVNRIEITKMKKHIVLNVSDSMSSAPTYFIFIYDLAGKMVFSHVWSNSDVIVKEYGVFFQLLFFEDNNEIIHDLDEEEFPTEFNEKWDGDSTSGLWIEFQDELCFKDRILSFNVEVDGDKWKIMRDLRKEFTTAEKL